MFVVGLLRVAHLCYQVLKLGVEPLIYRVFLTFNHFKVHQFTVNHIYKVWIAFLDMSFLFFILWEELCIGYRVTILFPHIKNVTNISHILLGHIQSIADNDSSYLLPRATLLKTGLFVVYHKPLVTNDAYQFFAEITVLLKHVVHRTECNIISITGIVQTETPCQSSKAMIQLVANHVGNDGRRWRTLWQHIKVLLCAIGHFPGFLHAA